MAEWHDGQKIMDKPFKTTWGSPKCLAFSHYAIAILDGFQNHPGYATGR